MTTTSTPGLPDVSILSESFPSEGERTAALRAHMAPFVESVREASVKKEVAEYFCKKIREDFPQKNLSDAWQAYKHVNNIEFADMEDSYEI